MKPAPLLALLAGIVIAAPRAGQAQQDTTAAPAQTVAPVVFAGDTLFYFHTRLGSFLPQARAQAVVGRLMKLSENPLARLDSLVINESETSTDILAGEVIIVSITDAEAAAAGLPRAQMAQRYAQKIFAALQKETESTSLKSILLGVLFTVIAIVVAIIVFKLVTRLFAGAFSRLEASRSTRMPALKIQNLEVLSADRITDTLIALTKALRFIVVLVLLYFFLPLVFSFFPWTEGLATTLFGYIFSPLRAVGRALLSYLPNIFFIAIIAAVTHYTTKFIHWIFNEIGKGTITLPGFYREWTEPTFKIVRFLVIAFAVIVVFPYLPGAKSPAFQGVSVFLGILFSLGSASAISNVVAGVVLTYTRAFNLRDRVKIGDTMGEVTEKTLLVTRIRTIKNTDITIPNAMVLSSHIINYSSSAKEHGLILNTTVTIGYDTPWRQIHELLLAAARNTENILAAPPPFVYQIGLDDFYVRYELNVCTDKPHLMGKIYSELHQHIQDRFNEAGVQIMSPHYIGQPEQVILPAEYLPGAKAASA